MLNKSIKNLSLNIALFAFLLMLVGCSVDENSVRFKGLNSVAIESVGATGVDAVFAMQVENTLAHKITLRKFSADILLDDAVIGVVVMDDQRKMIIPSRYVGSVDFPAKLRIPRVGFAEIAKIATGKGRYQIRLKADVIFGGVIRYVYKDTLDIDIKDISGIVREATGGMVVFGE